MMEYMTNGMIFDNVIQISAQCYKNYHNKTDYVVAQLELHSPQFTNVLLLKTGQSS